MRKLITSDDYEVPPGHWLTDTLGNEFEIAYVNWVVFTNGELSSVDLVGYAENSLNTTIWHDLEAGLPPSWAPIPGQPFWDEAAL